MAAAAPARRIALMVHATGKVSALPAFRIATRAARQVLVMVAEGRVRPIVLRLALVKTGYALLPVLPIVPGRRAARRMAAAAYARWELALPEPVSTEFARNCFLARNVLCFF